MPDENGFMKQRRKPGSRFLRQPERFRGFRITPRDVELLKIIYEYRAVQPRHVMALIPGNNRRLAYRLQGLWNLSYVDRLAANFQFRITKDHTPGGGSEPRTYVLDKKGAETLAEASGQTIEEFGFDPRTRTRADEIFLRHELMKATFRATLELAVRHDPELEIMEWRKERDCRDVVTTVFNGREEDHPVAPDWYVRVRDRGVERNFFIECDRGTSRDAKFFRKLQNYWYYTDAESPYYETYPNAGNRLILVVTTTPTRLAAMRKSLAKVDKKQRRLAQFWFTLEKDYDLMRPEMLLGPIWRQGPRTIADERERKPDPLKALFS